MSCLETVHVMTPTFYQSLNLFTTHYLKMMSLPNLILVALTVLAANAHQLRGNNQQFDISSACPINGNWAANADVCKQKYIRSQRQLTKTCNRNHRFTFVTHPDGTLQGTKGYVDSLTGDIRSTPLIGFWDNYKCTFKAVAVSAEVTFEGYVRHDGKLFVEATRPGGGSSPTAFAFQGTFTRQTETNGDWRIEG